MHHAYTRLLFGLPLSLSVYASFEFFSLLSVDIPSKKALRSNGAEEDGEKQRISSWKCSGYLDLFNKCSWIDVCVCDRSILQKWTVFVVLGNVLRYYFWRVETTKSISLVCGVIAFNYCSMVLNEQRFWHHFFVVLFIRRGNFLVTYSVWFDWFFSISSKTFRLHHAPHTIGRKPDENSFCGNYLLWICVSNGARQWTNTRKAKKYKKNSISCLRKQIDWLCGLTLDWMPFNAVFCVT